jgi:hypothetical protein
MSLKIRRTYRDLMESLSLMDDDQLDSDITFVKRATCANPESEVLRFMGAGEYQIGGVVEEYGEVGIQEEGFLIGEFPTIEEGQAVLVVGR